MMLNVTSNLYQNEVNISDIRNQVIAKYCRTQNLTESNSKVVETRHFSQ